MDCRPLGRSRMACSMARSGDSSLNADIVDQFRNSWFGYCCYKFMFAQSSMHSQHRWGNGFPAYFCVVPCIRGVPRLDGAQDKKQVWRPYVQT